MSYIKITTRRFATQKHSDKNKIMLAKVTTKYGHCEVKYVNALMGYKITIDGQEPTYFNEGLDHQEVRMGALYRVKYTAKLDEKSFQSLCYDIDYLRSHKLIMIRDDYAPSRHEEVTTVLDFLTDGLYLD
jgi:hypothetical protein